MDSVGAADQLRGLMLLCYKNNRRNMLKRIVMVATLPFLLLIAGLGELISVTLSWAYSTSPAGFTWKDYAEMWRESWRNAKRG